MITVHAGEQLDHFRIDRLVARSGMASIYQGTDLRTGQTVAIKIPHPEMECDPSSSNASSAKKISGKNSIIPE